MAATTVFVDKAVRGDFPPICVRTGAPADGWVEIDKPVGGMGAGAWVLLLLGPLGWLALAILSGMGTGRETLRVRLPYSRAVIDRYKARRRTLFIAGTVLVGGVILGVTGLLASLTGPILVGIVVAALVLAIVMQIVMALDEVDVKLDASRRWVTLVGVDERFAAAVEAQERSSQA